MTPRFPVAFRPPAFASWASCSRQGLPLSSRSAYQADAWTPAGFPRSAHPSHDRIGCPLYPEAQRCSHGRSDPSGRRSPPLPGARPYHPGLHPISRSCLLRGVIKGSLAFTRPAFPLACNPRMERGPLGLAPRASHPSRQDLRRTPGRGTGIEHSPGATRPALSDLQSVRSLAMCDLVSHDRPGHDPLPHRRPPGVLGEAVARGPSSPGPQAAAARPARATPTSTASSARPPPPPAGPTPSSASATGASSDAAASARPSSPSARSILVIIWHLLADPAARFRDLGAGYYASRIDTDSARSATTSDSSRRSASTSPSTQAA